MFRAIESALNILTFLGPEMALSKGVEFDPGKYFGRNGDFCNGFLTDGWMMY